MVAFDWSIELMGAALSKPQLAAVSAVGGALVAVAATELLRRSLARDDADPAGANAGALDDGVVGGDSRTAREARRRPTAMPSAPVKPNVTSTHFQVPNQPHATIASPPAHHDDPTVHGTLSRFPPIKLPYNKS